MRLVRGRREDTIERDVSKREHGLAGGESIGVSLAEALGQVDLEAGRVYRCRLHGQRVELRVLGPDDARPTSFYDESDVRLDPWVEFPPTPPIMRVVGRYAPTPLPDVPKIPVDEDEV